MKQIHTWKEPWKRKEAGSRTTRQKVNDAKGIMERAKTEDTASQDVKIVFDKKLWGMPQQIFSYKVELKIPLHSSEIMERMAAAFPELELKKEDL
jgi:hypothetical protein